MIPARMTAAIQPIGPKPRMGLELGTNVLGERQSKISDRKTEKPTGCNPWASCL